MRRQKGEPANLTFVREVIDRATTSPNPVALTPTAPPSSFITPPLPGQLSYQSTWCLRGRSRSNSYADGQDLNASPQSQNRRLYTA
jgi:hypothetical protein